MTKIILLPKPSPLDRMASTPRAEPATILLFTGIRYERIGDGDTLADGKDGQGKLRGQG